MAKIENALSTGTVLHGKAYDYKIVKVLGQGSFGITYQASVSMRGPLGSIDAKVDVAIKEFFMRDINGREGTTVTSGSKQGLYVDYRKKFIKEAHNLSKLQHNNIIKVIEAFEANGTVYYVMEYIKGGSLDDLIDGKGLSESKILSLSSEIGEALGFMHSSNMLHLDLKPANIMVKNGHAVLIDFGLSKQFDENGNPESSTTIGGGTPGYSPIEQTSKKKDSAGLPVTMDIYAFGATMFKMVTGHRPPEASEIFNDGFPEAEISEYPAGRAVKEIIMKAMEPMKKMRYQSVDEMLRAIYSISLIDNSDTNIDDDQEVEVVGIETQKPLRLPDKGIRIRVWRNDKQGVSKDVYLSFDMGIYETVETFYDGESIELEEAFASTLSSNEEKFLLDNGLLSTIHWENKSVTVPSDPTFGVDVSIEFLYNDGSSFKRRVAKAGPSCKLLNAVNAFLHLPENERRVFHGCGDSKAMELAELYIPEYTKDVTICYGPASFVGNNRNAYSFGLFENDGLFEQFVSEINGLHIKKTKPTHKELSTGEQAAYITIHYTKNASESARLYSDGADGTWGNLSIPFKELAEIVNRYHELYLKSESAKIPDFLRDKTLKIGSSFKGFENDYLIESVLYVGHSKIAFLASVPFSDKRYVIKEFCIPEIGGRREGEIFDKCKELYLAQAKRFQKVSSYCIQPYIEIIEREGTVYTIQEYVEGRNLEDLSSGNGLHMLRYQDRYIIPSIAEAITELHNNNIFHLDLSPTSIVIDDNDHPKIVDYGIIYSQDTMNSSTLTIGKGNPYFSPIERQRGTNPHLIDIYSFGAILYYFYVGENPPSCVDIFNEGFIPDKLKAHQIKPGMMRIVKKSMAVRWKDRYQSMDEMLKNIRNYFSQVR